MLPEIARRFTDAVLHEALRLQGQSPEDCVSLEGFEAHVFRLPGEILKITHTLRRDVDGLLAELELVEHLADRGVAVARALRFSSGRLVEQIPDGEGGTFLAYHFTEAPGSNPAREDWTAALLRQWGQVTGRINREAKSHVPSSPARTRPHWHTDRMYRFREHYPAELVGSIQRAESVLARLRALPRTADTYGLVHGDMHQYNFHVDESGHIIVFDFDDCVYHHFASEVALPLYHTARSIPLSEGPAARTEFGEFFLEHFIQGYQEEHPLTRAELEALPDFMTMRLALLMSVVQLNVWDDAQAHAEWLARYHELMESGQDPVVLDYEKIAQVWGRG
ncbi:MAG: phosphotransferase [Alphaproteobacteria bacterium]|nr:phosphotransferase [Alphaproteobacteria bacterium]